MNTDESFKDETRVCGYNELTVYEIEVIKQSILTFFSKFVKSRICKIIAWVVSILKKLLFLSIQPLHFSYFVGRKEKNLSLFWFEVNLKKIPHTTNFVFVFGTKIKWLDS